jgi:hypothetical protein
MCAATSKLLAIHNGEAIIKGILRSIFLLIIYEYYTKTGQLTIYREVFGKSQTNRVQMNPVRRKLPLDYVEISMKVMKRVLKLFSSLDINGLEI